MYKTVILYAYIVKDVCYMYDAKKYFWALPEHEFIKSLRVLANEDPIAAIIAAALGPLDPTDPATSFSDFVS